MKQLNKFFACFLGLATLTTGIVFNITACGNTNKYQNSTTGGLIQIKSKSDANDCKSVAINYINTLAPQVINTDDATLFKILTNSWNSNRDPDYAWASTQVYWELVYYMCNTYAKGTSSVEVQKADTTTGRCIFLQKNATVDILEIKNPAQIICKGFLDATWSDTYFRVFYKYNTDTRRFELHFQDNSDVFAINSYGLKNCQATTD